MSGRYSDYEGNGRYGGTETDAAVQRIRQLRARTNRYEEDEHRQNRSYNNSNRYDEEDPRNLRSNDRLAIIRQLHAHSESNGSYRTGSSLLRNVRRSDINRDSDSDREDYNRGGSYRRTGQTSERCNRYAIRQSDRCRTSERRLSFADRYDDSEDDSYRRPRNNSAGRLSTGSSTRIIRGNDDVLSVLDRARRNDERREDERRAKEERSGRRSFSIRQLLA